MLQTLRCVGYASADRLGAIVEQLGPIDVEDHLLALGARSLVSRQPGEFGGWGLTEAGKEEAAQRVASELEQAAASDVVRAAYRDFIPLNQRLLDLCGLWQMRTVGDAVTPNDHTDRAYDTRVLDEFVRLDAEAQALCSNLGEQLHRFSHYGPRLAAALAAARSGESQRLTDTLDSYHTVWFQLHEDLLVTLGITRTS